MFSMRPWKQRYGALELGNLRRVYRVVSKDWKEQHTLHHPRTSNGGTITIHRLDEAKGALSGTQGKLFGEDHL